MNSSDENILVAIHCVTYNHEPYIRDCLEGFLMQKTNFKFVAIVHDDVSTDKTADIIREYASKYPEIIKPIYETENQYSKFDGSLDRVMETAIAATGAKYVAMCEGDDYWIDPYKLQKQVDFLEAHEEFILCFHKCKNLIQQTGEITLEQVNDMPGETTIFDLAKGNYIHTPSVVYRQNAKVVAEKAQFPQDLKADDYVYWMLLAQYGNIMKLPDEMAVYRYGVGLWSPKTLSYTVPRWCNGLFALIKYFESIQPHVSEILKQQMFDSMESSLKQLEASQSQLEKIQKSRPYRLGKFLLKPFYSTKKFMKKKKK